MHAGVAPDAATGGILTPIHQSTTFVQESIDAYMAKGYSYSRTTNPVSGAACPATCVRQIRCNASMPWPCST